jgi:signal transduction histidine kinase
MCTDPAGESGEPAQAITERYRRFAELLRSDTAAILDSYAESLGALNSPVIRDPRSRQQTMTNAAEAIADIEASLQSAGGRVDDRYKPTAWTIGVARAENQQNPADSLRAAMAFFDVTVNALARHVRDDVGLLPCLITAVLTLNETISLRVREATLAYSGYLLDRVHQAHVDERRRIARDLHDRLGEGLSVALRQLEVYEIVTKPNSPESQSRAEIVKDALAEAMRRLRIVTSDLRQDSTTGLEKALISYIASATPDADVSLQVSGDETWASPTIIDETFMITREAIRNALTHGAPQIVLVRVAVAPDELRVSVDDDGCGFIPTKNVNPVFDGTGLATMHERTDLLAGQLTVTSVPGQGTHVELLVPLSGHRDA